MRPCTRVGLDVTWRCNWKCTHCFYRRNQALYGRNDTPMREITAKLDRAKEGGLDHAVLVGYGEPTLAPDLPRILGACRERGMATSIITNGATKLDRFKALYEKYGLNHLHISSHGIGSTLDEITGVRDAFEKQMRLKAWLQRNGWPHRTNVTIQLSNYHQLQELVDYEARYGVYHFVLLGFLPHYEWHDHVREVAVHPANLRPHLELAANWLLDLGILFTIRYHPFCHLDFRLWPYVVNARYVAFDPWEWNYDLQIHDLDALWESSIRCGESVANREPCRHCLAYRHCGGWNRTYAQAFGGADLKPVEEVPPRYLDVWYTDGGLHDLNPANRLTGTIRHNDRGMPT